MKAGWIRKKLGDVTTKIGSGATPIGGEDAYKTSGISLIRSLNVYDDGFRDRKLARLDEEQAARLSNVVVETGDVLLNITGASVARCCVAPADFLPARVNQHVAIIRPVKRTLESAFLHYLLISRVYKERLLHTGEEGGSTRQAITKAQLQDFSIEFPESLPEQRRIVTLLDEAFADIATAKANAEKNLQNARAIFESHLDAVLSRSGAGYTATTLGGEVDLLPGYAFPSGGYSDAVDAVRLLRGDNIMQGYFRWEEAKGWPSGDCESYSRFALQEGDVVIAMDRPWVKAGLKRAQISANDLPSLLVQRTSRLRTLGRMRMDFLSHLTGSQSFSRHLLDVQTGIGVPHISGKQIESFKFMLPPISDQESIANTLNDLLLSTQRLEEIYEEKLTSLDELKKSLLHRAFNGDL